MTPTSRSCSPASRERWIAPDTVGALTNPSWGLLDLRVEYNRKFGKAGAELFVDIFNVFNNQDSTRNQDLVAGSGGVAFGEPLTQRSPPVLPRSAAQLLAPTA